MSKIDTAISHEQVIPTLVTDVFDDNPDARFATGYIGYGLDHKDKYRDIFEAYARLRANVYIDQTRMLTPESRLPNGVEMDEDDERSTHFCMLENMGSYQRLVGAMRIIHGGSKGVLPIEKFFADFPFSTNHSGRAIEISRYIIRHEDADIQKRLKWQLYPSVLAFIMKEELGPTYAVVEPKLESGLIKSNVPLQRIAEPVFVPEYNDTNLGVLIDTNGLMANIEAQHPGSVRSIDFSTFTFSDNRHL